MCFLILFAREKSHKKKMKANGKNAHNGKVCYYKAGVLFLIDDCQQLTQHF